MNKTQIIEPQKQLLKTETVDTVRVCAYCRVSTDEADQKNSLKSQKQFFEDFFGRHSNWTNVGIFADEGISGTSLNKRDEFKKMVSIAMHGGIDLIVTKEVSRFSRNVRDVLNVVEELRSKKVYIWFLSDDINTERVDFREKLTQVATNAEQESLRTSRRVKWGQRQQMANGVVFGRKEMFGYRIERDETGKQNFEIVPAEAEIVKQIFNWFASGDGTYIIARRLESMGVKTQRYKNGWSTTVILRILRNEKYVGDLAQGKTYTPDPLTHEKKYNRGEYTKYYEPDHHPESAIIDRELWDKVQKILKKKAPDDETKAKHSNRYWTSGKIFCGLCGGRYVSMRKKQKTIPYKAWVCFENHTRGPKKVVEKDGQKEVVGCDGKRVNDRVLKMAMHDVLTQLIIPHHKEICDSILKEVKATKKPKDNSLKMSSLLKKADHAKNEIADVTRLFAGGKITEEAYQETIQVIQKERDDLSTRIAQLKADIDLANQTASSQYSDYLKQINEIVSLTDEQLNEELFGRITERIVVYPEHIIELHLSFLTRPIILQYKTHGKGDEYKADFTILSKEDVSSVAGVSE